MLNATNAKTTAKADCPFSNVHISAQTPLTLSQSYYVRRAAHMGVTDHTALQQAPRVKVLPGGMVAKQFKGASIKMPKGGPRGEVCGFSKSSSKRLKLKLMMLNFQACEGGFLTLTWHNFWAGDWKEWKKARRRFERRLYYHWPTLLGHIWRLEFQQRGAPHFHLLLCWQIGGAPQEDWFDTWVRAVWNECIGAVGDADHAKYGAKYINIKEGKGGLGALIGYLCKEMGKSDQAHLKGEDGDALPTGRTWGIVGDVPMGKEVEIELTPQEWAAFCDRVQVYGKGKGWYLSSINMAWPGFILLGGVNQIGGLLAGLGGIGNETG